MATELGKIEELELELANLKKERSQVENRLKEFEQKEKLFQPRTHFRPKRDRELGTSQENPSKRMRSSTQTVRDEKEDKPKITSAIVSTSGTDEKATRVNDERMKQRNARMFGSLLGHLKQFKTDLEKKSDAILRREEIEQKVTEKVIKEQEALLEKQKQEHEERKAKEMLLRDDIKMKQEEKELRLLNLKWQIHHSELEGFLKTETKPPIYYRPVRVLTSNEKKSKD